MKEDETNFPWSPLAGLSPGNSGELDRAPGLKVLALGGGDGETGGGGGRFI